MKFDIIATDLMVGGPSVQNLLIKFQQSTPLILVVFQQVDYFVHHIGVHSIHNPIAVFSRSDKQRCDTLGDSSLLRNCPSSDSCHFHRLPKWIDRLCLKSTVELIKTSLEGYHNFSENPQALLFPLSTVISVALHISLLNAALKYYDALLVVPLVQSSLIFYNIMAGGIILDEFSSISQNGMVFPLATLFCIAGILILMFKPEAKDNEGCGRAGEQGVEIMLEEGKVDQNLENKPLIDSTK